MPWHLSIINEKEKVIRSLLRWLSDLAMRNHANHRRINLKTAHKRKRAINGMASLRISLGGTAWGEALLGVSMEERRALTLTLTLTLIR